MKCNGTIQQNITKYSIRRIDDCRHAIPTTIPCIYVARAEIKKKFCHRDLANQVIRSVSYKQSTPRHLVATGRPTNVY